MTNIKKAIAIPLIGAFLLQVSACGTIMHPERKGQSEGSLNTKIVVLDAIGLLFYLVPGVIAFAVDFNNGSIYLPKGSASIDAGNIEAGNINVVNIQGDMTNEKIEQVLREQTGTNVSLDKDDVELSEKSVTLSALENEVKFL